MGLNLHGILLIVREHNPHLPAAIIARGIQPSEELLTAVTNNGVPLLGTGETTSSLVAALVAFMNTELAPRITRHGVLVEVYGEGILLVGDSGVGKSETAIELIKRGHRDPSKNPAALQEGLSYPLSLLYEVE